MRKLPTDHLSLSSGGSNVRGAASHGGVLFVIYETAIEAFDLESGELIHAAEIDRSLVWKRDRFFWRTISELNGEWHALSFDGSVFQFDLVHIPESGSSRDYVSLFDREAKDGPFGLHDDGGLVNFSELKWMKPHRQHSERKVREVLDVSDDGFRLLMARVDGTHLLLQWGVGQFNVPPQIRSLSQFDINRMKLGRTLRHRFSRIVGSADGGLNLVSKSQIAWRFSAQGSLLSMNRVNPGTRIRDSAMLEQGVHPYRGCGMMVATWKDGSRAWIDSRGLLHLRSSDREIPEATFVLHERDVAVWTSDGRICGSKYFVDTGSHLLITPHEVVEEILKPFAARLEHEPTKPSP
jgi:hypothetical protein